MTGPELQAAPGLDAWIRRLFADHGMDRMGHNQAPEAGNLGLGWIYYGLARIIRPRHALVIGSWRGFVPAVIARALRDTGEPGFVTFIDPSLVDDFWKDPERTRRHFANFGLDNVRHHLHTTQEFVATEAYRQLPEIGLLFIDGYHTADQARIDFEAFSPRLGSRGIALFHDSMGERQSPIYGPGRHYAVTVRDYMRELESDPALQVLDFPFGTGLTLVRRHGGPAEEPLMEGAVGRR